MPRYTFDYFSILFANYTITVCTSTRREKNVNKTFLNRIVKYKYLKNSIQVKKKKIDNRLDIYLDSDKKWR